MSSLGLSASSIHGGFDNILKECRQIDDGIAQVMRNLEMLDALYERRLNEADTPAASSNRSQLEDLSSKTVDLYHNLHKKAHVLSISSAAHSPSALPHLRRIDNNLKTAIQQYQQIEAKFQQRTRDQLARQYRIVRPEASDDEIGTAIETKGRIFRQALMTTGTNQMDAPFALTAALDRHAALAEIEKETRDLAHLFQEVNELVIQQDKAITNVEENGERAVKSLQEGNSEMDKAIVQARSVRRKKWICVGLCGMLLSSVIYFIANFGPVLVISIVIIVVLVYIFFIRKRGA
ncbi:Syntaxin-like protein psy1 [Purpureocillium lavendulum]|uniref:Syntaxin-like protein psy1 n=1 Tax=Purpureocillium lavendulum TaxID=1247861 RepID=A0AB34FIA2_9HYPO|nr:Syntaxin-like protein psy1 [Purpureocillium lavendulum]